MSSPQDRQTGSRFRLFRDANRNESVQNNIDLEHQKNKTDFSKDSGKIEPGTVFKDMKSKISTRTRALGRLLGRGSNAY